MAQRLNKKLLLGLGSSLGFLGTAVISSFGIKAIVDNRSEEVNRDRLAFNVLQEADFKTAPDYNVATQNMFVDTTNLKSFHFGNTQIGQTVTPYGWLGVFEDSQTKKNRIALTSWSGEILWINEDYKNESSDQYNVYDMKYDFNSNLIFVIRTNSPNGMFSETGNLAPLRLDILDAKTGKNVYNVLDSNYWINNIQTRARNRFQQIFFETDGLSTNDWRANRQRWKNLFYLDIASRPGSDRVVVSYIPKFTQIVQKRRLNGVTNAVTGNPEGTFVLNDQNIKLISVKEFIDSWRETVLTIQILLDNAKKPTGHNSRRYWLRKSRQINPKNDEWLIGNNNAFLDMKEYFLIANPFLTISNRGNVIIHFIAASENNDIWHKTIGFAANGHSESDTIRRADFSQNLRNTNLFTLPQEVNFRKTWGYADRWNDLFANANLIPNRNIFDNNSIVIAYPYASNENAFPNRGRGLPVFNVQQLAINDDEQSGVLLVEASRTGRNPKQSWNYTFGKDIADNYNTMGGSFYPSGDVNGAFPWPFGQISSANIDRQYNRLLTVSPFDNTVVYAAKANLNLPELIIQESNRDRSVGLWIANRNNYNLNQGQARFARPFLITNWDQGDAARTIDLQMTNPKSLYTDGVTFDIFSLQSQNNGAAKLNLYFNHTGSGRNGLYNNNRFLTSKIGLLDDVLSKDPNLWTENIANLSTLSGTNTENLKKISSTISNNSYATLIHSRANLETWFARTWLNNTKPANLYIEGYRLNAAENESNRATAQQFGNTLSGAEFNSQTSVDLVSHWQNKNGANPPNYNRLAIKRPKIIVKGSVNNKLPIETTYDLINNGNDFFNKPGWGINRNNLDRIVFKTRQEITNASYQIFSSWKDQVRINEIRPNNSAITTSNFDIRESHTWNGQQPQWYDIRQQGASTSNQFGRVHNEVAINQINPLRVVLKIAKPEGTLPAWFKTIDETRFFNTKYPLAKDALPGESTFQEIVQSFLAEKAQKIDLSQNNDAAAVGFGNLKIDAYLDVNPRVINNANLNSKIFTDGRKRILTLNDGQRIIYNDLYAEPYHEIYDQSAINYTDFNNWGFGKINNDVRNRVQTSWTVNIPPVGTKINTSVNYSLIVDKLVRFSPGNNENLFNFDYAINNSRQLELSPVDVDWFKNHFFNYNRLVNLFVQFEYQLSGQTNSNSWNSLGNFYTDQDLKNAFNATTNKLILTRNVVPGITKLRFKLTSKGQSANNDPNHFVELNRFDGNNDKYISKAHNINTQKVIVNNQWFTTTKLNPAGVFLQDLTTNHLQIYEDQILQQSPSIKSDPVLKTKIRLEYKWPSEQNWQDANGIIRTIKSKLTNWNGTDQGVWSLWNGTNWNNVNPNLSGYKIQVRFAKLNSNEAIDFVNDANQIQNGNNLVGDLRADIKTKVNLGSWLSFLKSQKITAQKSNVNGVLNPRSLAFPNMIGTPGTSQFAGRSFVFIQQLLFNAGIRLRFKRWDANQGTWSDWLNSINDLTTYNPSDPKITIGFRIDNPNIAVKDGNSDFTSNTAVELNLNLPKIVKAPTNSQQVIQQFNQQNSFSGNTFNLQIDNTRLASAQQQVINALKIASQSGSNAGGFANLDNALEFKYQLGNSGWRIANDLQSFLNQQNNFDQNDNTLKLQVSIKTTHTNEFQLDNAFFGEFILHSNNNNVIKKWIHGTIYETALARRDAITLNANSSKNNLQYNYHSDLQPLFEGVGREGLVIQWSLGSNPNRWNELKNGNNPLPTNVAAAEANIKVRVAKERNNQIYLYGPEETGQQTAFTLNLSQIPAPIEIDRNWFNELTLSITQSQFLQNIDEQTFRDYENQFFARSSSLSGNNSAALRAKVKLQYQFNKTSNWMDRAQIVQNIKQKLNNFNSTDQGIWALSHDGLTYKNNAGYTKNVYVINARVVANDASVQFVSPTNPNQPITGAQLEGNLKSDIKTRVDLTDWLNEIITVGISAARGSLPGQLQPNTINIPGKRGPTAGQAPIQLGNKTFVQIQTILNAVNIFVQYKKYDPTTATWSGWLSDSNEITSYDVRKPEIVIGFKSGNNNGAIQDQVDLNVQVFKDDVEFINQELKVKLNVPKLVSYPISSVASIQKFNAQKAFDGNTYQLNVNQNKLQNAQTEFINDVKAASQNDREYDNLNNVLVFRYKIANSDWKNATDLKTFLANQRNLDQPSNELKMKIELLQTNGQAAEFELDPNQSWEFSLLPDNNTIIKKYLHGTAIEADLVANKISVSGSKNNLQYTFTGALKVFEVDGNDLTRELILQYRLLDNRGNPVNQQNQNWTSGTLPNNVNSSVQRIEIRVGHNPAIATNQAVFVYGPEINSNQQKTTIDLSRLATVIAIDRTWLEANPIATTTTDSQRITIAQIEAWETNVWANVAETKIPEIKQKLIIRYQFAKHNSLTAQNLFSVINNELNNFNDPVHHGIVKLHDKTLPGSSNNQPNGFTIKATIEKISTNDQTIQFVDQNGTNIDDDENKDQRTGVVDTSKITTTLNLTDWIKTLIEQKTAVNSQTAGQITSLNPPTSVGPATRALFAAQTFNQIEQWLKAAQINLFWNNNPNNPNGWLTKDQIQTYDATQAKLWFAINNNSSNLVLTLGNNLNALQPKNHNRNQPIVINLDAPKLITINPSNELQGFANYFSGNTKYLTVQTTEIKKRINQFLTNLGSQFQNAPLTLMVRIGNEAFVDYKNLAATLKAKSTDVANGSVVVQFAIDKAQTNGAEFDLAPGGDAQIEIITDPTKIKVFINDQEIFDKLKTAEIVGRDNTNFNIRWPDGWTVETTSGLLNALNKQGLRLEFSFKDLPQSSGVTGSDPDQQWVRQRPTRYKLNQKKLYVRIQTTSANFIYERIASHETGTPVNPPKQEYKFALDLNLPQLINLDNSWLNQQFRSTEIDLSQISLTDFINYENLVKNNIQETNEIKNKISINYSFNGQNNLDKEALIRAINNYQQAFTDQNRNFGLLQLWNNNSGEQIKVKFVKSNLNDSTYDLAINGQNEATLDLTKVNTTIDLQAVLTWLQTTKISVVSDPTITNGIRTLNFPSINAPGDRFDQKTWDQLKTALTNLNLKMQFRSLTNNNIANNDWVNTQEELRTYDPAVGKIQIRFQFEPLKATNLKARLDTQTILHGNQNQPSAAFDVSLDIKLVFVINRQHTDAFFQSPDVIRGNTKNLFIDEAAEQKMIEAIKAENAVRNPEFAKANLYVGYQLGQGEIGGQWKKRAEFIEQLNQSPNDQITNKIVYRLLIDQSQENRFETPREINVLHEHEAPRRGIKIPYYINPANWEANANKLIVQGTSSNLRWDFAAAFGPNVVIEQGERVYLQTAAGQSLQVFFTTVNNANYDNPQFGNNANEINSRWVSHKPTVLNAATTTLKVKLVALNTGFVYGPADLRIATAHDVELRIQREIIVDKNWFSEQEWSLNSIEISAFIQNTNLINQWENQIYEKIVLRNKIDLATAQKVQIKYLYGNQTTQFSALALIEHIRELQNDFNGPKLGLVQLWNGVRGDQIKAVFTIEDRNFKIRTAADAQPNATDLEELVKTTQIYTSISMVQYIELLKQVQTNVNLKPDGQPGEILNFTLPQMDGDPNSGILNGKSFDVISSRLNELGVQFKFAQNPTNQDNDWFDKAAIKNYNPQLSALFLSIEIATKETNVRVQISGTETLQPGQNLRGTKAIRLPLNVPKYIIVNQGAPYFANLAQKFAFRGNTKNLNFNKANIQTFLDEILNANVLNSGDQSYKQAPLKIHFQVGDEAFTEIDQLQTYLQDLTTDLPNRQIRFKLVIPDNQTFNWKLIDSETTYEIFTLNDPLLEQIKIFINDNGNFEILKNLLLKGSQDNLQWPWNWQPHGNINEQTGILIPNPGGFGLGLKLQFSFNQQANVEGTDVEKHWVGTVPQSFKSKYNQIWVRIRLTNEDLYTYDYIDQPFRLSLEHIQKTIKVDTRWLNQLWNQGQKLDLENLSAAILTAYENIVSQMAQNDPNNSVDTNLLNKFKIQYQFNNDANWIDQADLLNQIAAYQTNTTQNTLGILQLWNGHAGVQIKARFTDNDSGDQYQIDFVDPANTETIIDTKNVISIIDFVPVLDWLKTLEIEIIKGNNNEIRTLKIPTVTANDTPFQNKTWNEVEQILQIFGLKIEYSNYIKTQQPNWGPIANVNQYDPTSPVFQIRFTTDGQKSLNINLQWTLNEILSGATAVESSATIIKIKAPLLVQIDSQLLTKFETDAVFAGDTKNLNILNVINQDDELVAKIIEANLVNDPRYEQIINLDLLEIQYIMQRNKPDANANWQDLNGLVNFLKTQDRDQNTNQIWYRIYLKNTADFNLDNQALEPKILNAHQDPNPNIRVKYYINSADWEAKAARIIINGPSDALQWNLATIFNNSIIEENQQVYLRNIAGKALQIYFTTNPNATYELPADLSNNPAEIASKWVAIKPNQVRPGETNLKIKLVANPGFVYGPANVIPQEARAHSVQINVQNVLYVDRNWLASELVSIQTELRALNQTNFNVWEEQIYQKIKTTNQITNDVIARKVRIKYFFKGKKLNSFQDLLTEIERFNGNYGDTATLGILQLWNEMSQRGEKVEAIFELDQADQRNYVLKTRTNPNPSEADLHNLVNTNNLYTLISLINYIKVLSSQNTSVDPDPNGQPGDIRSFSPPKIAGDLGSGFLVGYSFDQIMARLNQLGIEAKFTKIATATDQDWVGKNQITNYDIRTSALFLSFEIATNAQNVKVQWATNDTLEPGNNLRKNPIRLNLDVPKYILINPAADFWRDNKQNFYFRGNTKSIDFNQDKIDEFIQKILKANADEANDASFQGAPLKIEFQVGNTAFTEIKELKNYLANDIFDDLTHRNINFRFSLPDSATQNWKLLNPQAEYSLLSENDPEITKLKIYINDKGIFEDLKQTKLSGSSQNLQWEFKNLNVDPTDGVLSALNRGVGLRIEFTFSSTVAEDAPTDTDINQDWVRKMPNSFGVNKTQIFIRLALTDENKYYYEQKHKKIPLSLSDIILVLNLQTVWLKLIQLSGNTKNLEINEELAKLELNKVLPANQLNLVQLKYSVDAQTWIEANAFKTLLQNLNGAQNDQNFILKRDAIKVRFELDQSQNDKFQIVVDQQSVQADNNDSPTVQLINDDLTSPLNTTVQGYIELEHLKHFVLDSFAIEGTNDQPKLIIKKQAELETLMQNYATDNLFDIWITSEQKADGTWDFAREITLLKTGNKFINNAELVTKGFTLGANKKVALKFVAKNPKYDVYYNGKKYADGYDLDISSNVRITFEIENPFTKNNKTLALWWTADNNKKQAKYYQGEGGFKIVNGMANGAADVADFQAAQAWLQSAQSGLSQKEKSVLEFVYYIYDDQPDQQAINDAQRTITDYQNSKWKKVADVLETGNTNFTTSLKLKVGQYVSVALRVKAEYASGNDVYALKDGDDSFVKPIDGLQKFGRVHGYKINVADLNIEENNITLENILNFEQAPLDGYTNIKNLTLTKDEKENYKGVDLELQLFHQFYRRPNQQDEVIITPFDKIKLIKRQQNNGISKGNFKNADGSDIKDENNNAIPILLDANGLPTAPEEASNATFKAKFINYDEGFFGLTVPQNENNRSKWGIFKNETVKIIFSPRQGIGGVDDPDFILEQAKEVDLKEVISKQIKFPLFNQENIKYQFNYEEFTRANVRFEHATNPNELAPIDGRSKVKTLIKLVKTTSTNPIEEIISGTSVEEAVEKLKKELLNSFNGKIGFKTIYERKTGSTQISNGLNLYQLNQLQNNDRIKVQIVATDDNFIWAEPPRQLTIHVSGLTAKAPRRDRLRFLRVEQSGSVNGKGTFRVLINDPSDRNSDAKSLLEGWKFVIRVWNASKEIKTNWTDDQNQIVNLSNNDKVEWKLLDEFNNPVNDAYYNTVAGNHSLNNDGTTNFVFNQVHYPNGKESATIVSKGIGDYPKNPDDYPENSGFVISGLQDQVQTFEIDETIFARIINQLEPRYVGFNGQGSINFNEDYLNKNYYINQTGELYEKPLSLPALKQQIDPNVKEISLTNFLANTTFYTSDPNLINYQNGFKFLGNDTNLNNNLSNGDQVWAQFDLKVNNNEIHQGISTQLNSVSGLQEVLTDPMTPLWYILMAIGGAITLGGLSLFLLWAKRHKKLKK